MKIIIYFMTILGFWSYHSIAADVQITVNGRVLTQPCSVSTDSVSKTVDLHNLQSSELLSPGSFTEWNDVTLSLNNCPAQYTRVTAIFSGEIDDFGYYKNMGTAKNIGIEIQGDGNEPLLNGGKKIEQINISSRDVIFRVKVRGISMNGGVTAGSINSLITVTYSWD